MPPFDKKMCKVCKPLAAQYTTNKTLLCSQVNQKLLLEIFDSS